MLGTKLIFDLDILIKVVVPVLTLFSFVFVFQILSAMLAAKYTGGYKWYQSVMVGLGMLGRAELAFIVINIAYTQNNIINLEQFYILICTVFLLNISVPVMIKLWKPYYLGTKTLKLFGQTFSKR
jgi:Kef-type K+ transport system membrane component KefB